jgi:hypothetical protein
VPQLPKRKGRRVSSPRPASQFRENPITTPLIFSLAARTWAVSSGGQIVLDPLRAHKDLHLARSTKLAWRTNGLELYCPAVRAAPHSWAG